jgi:hypothetical protein
MGSVEENISAKIAEVGDEFTLAGPSVQLPRMATQVLPPLALQVEAAWVVRLARW